MKVYCKYLVHGILYAKSKHKEDPNHEYRIIEL